MGWMSAEKKEPGLRTEIKVVLLSFLISLTAFFIGFVILLNSIFYRKFSFEVDRTREELFALRDKLFDLGKNGEVPFDSDGFELLWNTINGTIRYGDKLTLYNGIIETLFLKEESKEYFHDRYEESLQELNRISKAKLVEVHRELVGIIISHLIRSSILTHLFFWILGLIDTKSYDKITEQISVRTVEAEAYRRGKKEADSQSKTAYA